MEKTKFTIEDDKKTLTIERTFQASQSKLWRAYTEKDMFEQWFAPEGWSVKTKKFDFVEGGENIYVMTCEDKAQGEWFGQSSSGKMVFENINPVASFGYTDYFTYEEGVVNESMPSSSSTVELETLENGSTLLRVKTVYATEEGLKQVLEMGMREGYAATLDKLEKLLVGDL